MKLIAAFFLMVMLSVTIFAGTYAMQAESDNAQESIDYNFLNTSIETTDTAMVSGIGLLSGVIILVFLLVVVALVGVLWSSIR